MKFGLFFPLTVAVSLTGCVSYNPQIYQPIDRAEKTITVPTGSAGLTGQLKRALADDGWKLSVRRGPRVTEGTVGEKTKVEQYDTFKTRYELRVSWNQFDVCIRDFSPAIYYDLSVIDNKTGEESVTMGGRGCESGVVEKFIEALKK